MTIAKQDEQVVASVNCALSRARTGMSSSEMACALPGRRLTDVLERLEATSTLDRAMANYAVTDARPFAYILVMQRTEGAHVRLAPRASLLIFLAFSAGDILFGDRMELWEHGTFMILALLTYRFYLDRQNERDDIVGLDHAIADLDEDGSISTSELKAFLKGAFVQSPGYYTPSPAPGASTN